MAIAENPRAVAGDNASPADPLIVEMNERIDAANRWLKERLDWEKWDLATADKANFFIEQIQATWKALDDRRLDEGRDFKKKQDAFYKDPLALLVLAKSKIAPLRTEWLKREDDRVLEEKRKAEVEAERLRKVAADAEKKAQDALKKKGGDPLRAELEAGKARDAAVEAAVAADNAPEKARITGDYSSRAKGLTDYWSGQITDISLAFKHYNSKNSPYKGMLALAIQSAIERFVNEDARKLKDETKAPPGTKFIKDRR